MKKINSILAIAAVALTSVFGFSSCDKEEDVPAPEPKPEQEKVADRTIQFVVSNDLLDACSFNINILRKNQSNEDNPLVDGDFKEVSDMTYYADLVAQHNTGVDVDTPELKINNASDLKKYYKVYTYTLKNVKETEQITVSFSKTTKKATTAEQLNSKEQFFAYYVGNIQEGKFHYLTGNSHIFEKNSGMTKETLKEMFMPDFGKEFDLK